MSESAMRQIGTIGQGQVFRAVQKHWDKAVKATVTNGGESTITIKVKMKLNSREMGLNGPEASLDVDASVSSALSQRRIPLKISEPKFVDAVIRSHFSNDMPFFSVKLREPEKVFEEAFNEIRAQVETGCGGLKVLI